MCEPYIQSTREALGTEDADIVFDRFHVVDHLNRAVDQVRRAEHRQLMSGGNDRLKGTRYLWLKKELSLSKQWYRTALANSGLKVGRAWAIKDPRSTFMEPWCDCCHVRNG